MLAPTICCLWSVLECPDARANPIVLNTNCIFHLHLSSFFTARLHATCLQVCVQERFPSVKMNQIAPSQSEIWLRSKCISTWDCWTPGLLANRGWLHSSSLTAIVVYWAIEWHTLASMFPRLVLSNAYPCAPVLRWIKSHPANLKSGRGVSAFPHEIAEHRVLSLTTWDVLVANYGWRKHPVQFVLYWPPRLL